MFDTDNPAHEYDIASPGATALFESLRAFGYDLPTALADVIDNSITAEARNVWIDFFWKGAGSRIIIRDDGCGMTETELVQSMRPGSRNPLEVRDLPDLGRFGLGMKTASISQCRCLTVMSRTAVGRTAVRSWDLDYIANEANGEWRLLKGEKLLSSADLELLDDLKSGTVLFWDRLDQLVGDASENDETAQRHFRECVDHVKDHLAMTFHRFMKGRGAVNIFLNDRRIEPWDPFLEEENATDPLPDERHRADGVEIVVKPFILPHHSKIAPEVHAAAAGPRGWNAHQGFYIYRNKRLLVAGDWLGLGMQKEEHYKLARIRVDLPNTADTAWQIDVKKSRACPPTALRGNLKRIARTARSRAAQIYRHRGKIIRRKLGTENEFLWKHLIKHGKTFYKINRDHPLVKKALAESENVGSVRALLSMVEQTIPAPLIVINNAENPDGLGVPFDDSPAELLETMAQTYDALVEDGRTASEAAHLIATMEPFHHFPEKVGVFLETLSSKQTRRTGSRQDK